MTLSVVRGSVCAPEGFRAGGATAGLKESGRPDVALIVSDGPAASAGLFTQNTAAAAPVLISRQRVGRSESRGIVINSGCANACTGPPGIADAIEMAEVAASQIGCDPESFLVCSTGLIGSRLPMDLLREGIARAGAALSRDDDGAATAIMTTDTIPKRAALTSSQGWSVGGIAKGAAMISPNMATMLALLTTDAAVGPEELKDVLSEAVHDTFNSITIDGDTSTNDTILLLANGRSKTAPAGSELLSGVRAVCRTLAEMIVRDAEGATKFVRVRVRGAATADQARAASRAVSSSVLVKTAVHGEDPNWGRIVAAIGNSGASVDMGMLTVSIEGIAVFEEGSPAGNEAKARAAVAMKGKEITISCDLMAGNAVAECLTSDLSPEYVRLNSEYET
ncbi:MAG TPA: bifunctional glutamate N-acetyltransferase/amino-acid acetyltransferase ArgJ [Actinomycetota bacterium]|nr:bifunctional glutamate N-acetyltransferase/amino-acid acetyltransferase ArgJ [Actinomycetota bacterium]